MTATTHHRERRAGRLRIAGLLLFVAALAVGCGYAPPFVINVPGTYHIDNTNELFRHPTLRVAVCLDSPSAVDGSVQVIGGKGIQRSVSLEWNGQSYPLGGDPTPVLQAGCGVLLAVPVDCCDIPDAWIVTLERA